jgi:integrase
MAELAKAGIGKVLGAQVSYSKPSHIRDVSDRVKAMAAACPDTLAGKRDRALMLLGFGGAFRRSELVALDAEHLEEAADGLRVYIAQSKTDQEAEGVTIAIARGSSAACPVQAVREWLDAAGIETGPVFRPINKVGAVSTERLSDRSVANIVKAYAGRVGLDEKLFAGHSLRSGFLTSAAGNGASIFKMMDVSRHKSVDTLRGYVRDAELFKDHAGAGLL